MHKGNSRSVSFDKNGVYIVRRLPFPRPEEIKLVKREVAVTKCTNQFKGVQKKSGQMQFGFDS